MKGAADQERLLAGAERFFAIVEENTSLRNTINVYKT